MGFFIGIRKCKKLFDQWLVKVDRMLNQADKEVF
jgi:hypothetical protein